MSTDPTETYSRLWLSDFFHDFPHWDFHFKTVNSTFNPESNDYKQAIILWGLIPVAVCFVLWLVFLIYFIIRCRQNPGRSKQNPSSCLRVFTGLLILTGAGIVAFGFYENEDAQRGVDGVRRAMNDANNTIMTASHRVGVLDDIAEDISVRITDDLEEAVSGIEDAAVKAQALKLIGHIRTEANSVQGYLNSVLVNKFSGFFKKAMDTSDDVEYYRWMSTIIIYCLYLFIFLLSFIGLLMRSRRALIVSAALSVICSLFICMATGAYIGASVALGDLCEDPDSYFIGLAEGSTSEVAVKAYIKCTDASQPYQQDIVNAQTSISQAITDLNDTVRLVAPFHVAEVDRLVTELQNDLQYAVGNLSTLLNNVGICTTLHHDYIEGVNAACTDTIIASAFLALTSCLVGILCTVTIFCLSCLWRQYTKMRVRAAYVPVDDTDPFLPRPPPYESDYGALGHSSPRPWSERGTLQHTSAVNHEDQTLMLTNQHPLPMDDSPPPAYHPGQYVRQYADTGPTPNHVRSSYDV